MKINLKIYNFSYFFLCQKPKSRFSFVQLKAILDILLRDFSLSSCPQHNLKALLLCSLLLLNPVCPLKYVLNCEQNCSFFIFRSELTVTGLAKVY
jgi:hypothetical protein